MPVPESSPCPRCSAPVVEISIARGAATMKMRSCSACDTRWWDDDGQRVDLHHVLGRVAANRSRS